MEQLAELPSADRIGVSCVLPNPTTSDQTPEPDSDAARQLRQESACQLLTNEGAYRSFTPTFLRAPPPLHMGENPLIWVDPISDYVEKLKV